MEQTVQTFFSLDVREQDTWVTVVLKTFHDERWRANSIMCHGTFVSQDTSRCPGTLKWRKTHSDIRFERAELSDWRCICTNMIWITFQITLPCCLDLICKMDFMCFFAVQPFWNQSGYTKNPIRAGSLNKAFEALDFCWIAAFSTNILTIHKLYFLPYCMLKNEGKYIFIFILEKSSVFSPVGFAFGGTLITLQSSSSNDQRSLA